MEATGTVTISLYGNAFENKHKAEALQTIANLDPDVFEKLDKLAKSVSAVKMLRDNWTMLKMMLRL